jgi:hypothetical protein
MYILPGEAAWLPSCTVKIDIFRCSDRTQRHKAFFALCLMPYTVASTVAPAEGQESQGSELIQKGGLSKDSKPCPKLAWNAAILSPEREADAGSSGCTHTT